MWYVALRTPKAGVVWEKIYVFPQKCNDILPNGIYYQSATRIRKKELHVKELLIGKSCVTLSQKVLT